MTVCTAATAPESPEEVALRLAEHFESLRAHENMGRKKPRWEAPAEPMVSGTVECQGRDYEVRVTDVHVDKSGQFIVARGHKELGDNAFAWKAAISSLHYAASDHGTLLSAPGQPLLMLHGVVITPNTN